MGYQVYVLQKQIFELISFYYLKYEIFEIFDDDEAMSEFVNFDTELMRPDLV